MKITDAIEAGIAPRLAAGWIAVSGVLDDGDWHSYDELVAAATSTGLAAGTANNLLRAARQAGWLESERRGRGDTWLRLPDTGDAT